MNKNKIIRKIEGIQLKITSKKKKISKINRSIISYNCILVANISKDKKDIQDNLYQLKKEKKNLSKQINYLKYKFKKNIKLLNTGSIINNIQSESSNSSSSDSDIDTFIKKKNNNYNNYCQDISSSDNSLDSPSDGSEIEEKIDNSGNICQEETPLVNTNSCNETGQETSILNTNSYNEPELNCSSTENITMNIVKQSEEQGELQSLKIELEKVIMDENKQNLVENYDSDDSDDIRSLKQIISSL